MKRVVILLIFLHLAFTCTDASSIARERCRTKRNQDPTITEAPYVCLDAPVDLPSCNFGSESGEKTREKSLRQSTQLTETSTKSDDKHLPSFQDSEEQTGAMVIIYKIEGCIPSRLPFVLPTCKQEDSEGKIVQVRRLFPFNVMASSGYNADTTLVFPEIDMDQWHRFMHGPWTTNNSEDNGDQGERPNREISQSADSPNLSIPKILKRKKVTLDNISEKKMILKKMKKFNWMYGAKKFDDNKLSTKFPSVVAKLQPNDDQARDTNSYKLRSNLWNHIDDVHREDRPTKLQVTEKSPFMKYTEEFPYAKAIPYDPQKLLTVRNSFSDFSALVPHIEKLHIPRRESEFLYNRAMLNEPKIVENRKRNSDVSKDDELPYESQEFGVSRTASEFPYNLAIPYDPSKLLHSRGLSKFHNSGVLPHEPRNSSPNRIVDENYDYGFPQTKAIPYDSKKLGIVRMGSEFPYTRAIPYDPAKLRVATRGSEFPYAKAIPYDPKKLKARWSGIMNKVTIPFHTRNLKSTELESKSFESRGVPFDSSMLDAAKEGRTFPYAKAVPEDTSKIVEKMKQPKLRNYESIKVPVRHVRTFWDEQIPNYMQQIETEKNERGLEKIIGNRELHENIINTQNDDYPNDRARVARRAESNVSRDISTANGYFAIPGRWSEFPYSQAIPFDATKLRRQRSTMEDNLNSPFVVPRNFPYGKAIPYDPSKLVAFGRNKSNSA